MKLHFELPLLFVSNDETVLSLAFKTAASSLFAIIALEGEAADSSRVWFVLSMSLILGALGGLGAALRISSKESRVNWLGIAVHVVNMGLVGLSTALMALWWMDPVDDTFAYGIAGFSGLMGLVGLPILEPIADLVKKVIDRIAGKGPPKGKP